MAQHRSADERQRVLIGAYGLIGLGVFLLLQQTFAFGQQFVVLALGIGLYAAYLNQRHARSDLIVPAGIVCGLGVGIVLVSDNVTPGNIHAPIMLGALALGFGAVFVLGEARHAWAMWPAAILGIASVTVLATSEVYPGLDPTVVQLRPLWPLLLIGGGLWLLHRENWLR